MAAGRSARAAVELLEGAAAGSATGAGVADGPAPADSADATRRAAGVAAERGVEPRVAGVEPARRGDLVHGVARCLCGVAEAVHGTGRHRGGITDRGAQPWRGGRTDRVLCKHAGDAHGREWRPELPGVAGAGEGSGAGGVCASGPAV